MLFWSDLKDSVISCRASNFVSLTNSAKTEEQKEREREKKKRNET